VLSTPKKRSTRFSHDELVGIKCRNTRLFRFNQLRTFSFYDSIVAPIQLKKRRAWQKPGSWLTRSLLIFAHTPKHRNTWASGCTHDSQISWYQGMLTIILTILLCRKGRYSFFIPWRWAYYPGYRTSHRWAIEGGCY